MKYTWTQILKDSLWITMAWEWLQGLLGRAVDFVLWVTMIFACYQLIPGAPIPAQSVSVFMFIMQFIALDIGGMGLRQLAQRHNLEKSAFTYKIANSCIAVTFITLIFAGAQHATTLPQNITTWVEVTLVIARSGLTVLYGQAIRALKFVEQAEDERVKRLEEEVSNLRVQLDTQKKQVSTGQAEVSSVQLQLDSKEKEVSSLTVQLDILKTQLDGKQQELDGLKQTFTSGQQWQEERSQQLLEAEQRRAVTLQEQLDTQQERLLSVQQEASNLRLQLSSERVKVSSLKEQLDSQRVSTGHQEVSSTPVQLDTPRSGQANSENELGEQIRAILIEEPEISARALALRVRCSPTTASNWKKVIEQEEASAPRLHVVHQ